MSEAMNNLNGDPSQLTIQQKVELFEKSLEKYEEYKPLTYYNNFAAVPVVTNRRDTSTTDNNVSNTTNTMSNKTSTPVSSGNNFHARSVTSDKKHVSSTSSSYLQSHMHSKSFPNKLTGNINQMTNNLKSASSYYNSHESKVEDSSVNMKEFHDTIKDLDTFLTKELNEIEIQKRIGISSKDKKLIRPKKQDVMYGDQILHALSGLKEEINTIKENQRDFEDKIRRQEEYQYMKIAARINKDQEKLSARANQEHEEKLAAERLKKEQEDKKLAAARIKQIQEEKIAAYILEEQKMKAARAKQEKEKYQHIDKISSHTGHSSKDTVLQTASSIESGISGIDKHPSSKKDFDSPILTSSGYSREERIRKLEAEIIKEETLMMKINRVLENLKNVDDRNLLDIINIERHYLVASTRFQSALSEIRKLNENIELPHMPPYNRKGKLIIRDIMLEVKASYFQRPLPIRNEFLLILMKYEDKVLATKPMRIIDDIRTIKFSEKFSIPEIYMDFDMRLEIYGTTFWRKNASVRETMLKKYGFITFSLADTGNKSKRFQMIEVLQSDNVPIRNKVVMKISQKITADVQYKGKLFVKLRDVWHEAVAHLNGHLLEISFKKIYNSGVTRSQEVMLLDLYNVDSDAVIPVDVRRISDKPYTFLLKFNHYVDVANFYLMVAAESAETFSEWINALNKVLILIK
ncbi:anillin-like [Chironomus tepperi]|uniref:anillin-like n=1 Tax=Chironomus tepperi TaxID=113505 RepID=UPI00391EF5FA